MEAVGIILAILPLLASTAKRYDDCLRPFIRYYRFTSKVDQFKHKLDIQRLFFRNECRILLESVIEHDVANRMLDDKAHPQWEDNKVEKQLVEHLGDSGEVCISIIKQIKECLKGVEKDGDEFESAVQQSGQVGFVSWSTPPDSNG